MRRRMGGFLCRHEIGLILLSSGCGMLIVIIVPWWGFFAATLLVVVGAWLLCSNNC